MLSSLGYTLSREHLRGEAKPARRKSPCNTSREPEACWMRWAAALLERQSIRIAVGMALVPGPVSCKIYNGSQERKQASQRIREDSEINRSPQSCQQAG